MSFFKKDKEMWKLWDISANKKLVRKYPFLLINSYKGKEKYISTWADYFPKGWWKAFGEEFCKELKAEWKKLPRARRKAFTIMQIKEKYNELRVYTFSSTKEIDEVIKKYERLSPLFCAQCGERATKVTTGYNISLCDKCFEEINDTDFTPIEIWLDIGEV